jgi:hypothetical protein
VMVTCAVSGVRRTHSMLSSFHDARKYNEVNFRRGSQKSFFFPQESLRLDSFLFTFFIILFLIVGGSSIL